MAVVLVQSYHPVFQDVVKAFHLKEIPMKGDLINDIYGRPDAGEKVSETFTGYGDTGGAGLSRQ